MACVSKRSGLHASPVDFVSLQIHTKSTRKFGNLPFPHRSRVARPDRGKRVGRFFRLASCWCRVVSRKSVKAIPTSENTSKGFFIYFVCYLFAHLSRRCMTGLFSSEVLA
ncbi:hypothetical protein CSUI_006287 [Cystoisospora suis]|uniref:Uncharacterized protein n=1 Tax=Cystoisospora suis TaxID=483139 RepID=A0A2C6KHB9_9APIC|nr:hypothetical protein CSUI_006287 [Cystoisospora suis]